MCGIVGAVSTRNIVPDPGRGPEAARIPRLRLLRRRRAPGRRAAARAQHRARGRARGQRRAEARLDAGTGIAHTRWATHGAPAVHNAHPHFSPGRATQRARIALVHNGIIENHDELRAELQAARLRLREPDRHRGHRAPGRPPVRRRPVRRRAARRRAAARAPTRSRCSAATSRTAWSARARARRWCWAWASGENFLASDAMALAGVTDQIVYLEEGDVVDLQLGKHWIAARQRRRPLQAPCSARCAPCRRTAARPSSGPTATTCRRRSSSSRARSPTRSKASTGITPELFGDGAYRVFKEVDQVLILACGTSYYAG